MLLNVTESLSVTSELEAAAIRYPRTWDAWDALVWVLARGKCPGLMISSVPPPWYLYKQDARIPDAPTLTLTYSVDAQTVIVHTLRAT